MRISAATIKQLLYNHYRAPLRTVFKQFRLGAALFLTGLVMVYIAHQTMTASMQQELLTLTGLVILGCGFLIAMLAQLRMIIIRIFDFLEDKP